MPTIPILIEGHKLWTFVDSGATFSILSVDEAHRIGIEWDKGRRQMIVVVDGSFIPTYFQPDGDVGSKTTYDNQSKLAILKAEPLLSCHHYRQLKFLLYFMYHPDSS